VLSSQNDEVAARQRGLIEYGKGLGGCAKNMSFYLQVRSPHQKGSTSANFQDYSDRTQRLTGKCESRGKETTWGSITGTRGELRRPEWRCLVNDSIISFKNNKLNQAQWFTSVIPATWEAEIRKDCGSRAPRAKS
jgi:hypothetical protein